MPDSISSFASSFIQSLSLTNNNNNNTQHDLPVKQEQRLEKEANWDFNAYFSSSTSIQTESESGIKKTFNSRQSKYLDPSIEEFEALKREIESRLLEGCGEFIMELSLDDDGNLLNFVKENFEKAVETVKKIAYLLNSEATLLPLKQSGNFVSGWLLIRRSIVGNPENMMEIRIACVGNVDAGKSTLLGVLISGELDDGRGRARVNLFKHKHEIDTGRTSSVGMEIMGFDVHGKQIVKNENGRKISWEDIAISASKVLTFLDLAGHEKYLKTTVFGMTGCAPDYVMLIVGSNAGIIGMTKEHLGLALALNVPVLVVVTKVDMCPPNVLDSTLKQLSKVLKSPGSRKIPMFIRDLEDVVVTARNFVSERICPVFQISNVSGLGLSMLRQFLNLLPLYKKYNLKHPVEYQITDKFSVPGVGTVISGTALSGVIHTGDSLLLGPDTLGNFVPCVVKSIHRKKVLVNSTAAGQSSSLALKKIKRSFIRKGMVLVGKEMNPQSFWEFEAEILILYHSSTIAKRYQAMVHCGNVRQTARIVAIRSCTKEDMEEQEKKITKSDGSRGEDKEQIEVIRTGDRAVVRFRFLQYPEFLREGSRVLFREGRTKGVGKILHTFQNE